jgi:hypothetical protein
LAGERARVSEGKGRGVVLAIVIAVSPPLVGVIPELAQAI